MPWIVTINAEDGTHNKLFAKQAAAWAEYFNQIGRAATQADHERFEQRNRIAETDDWGRRISMQQAPACIKTARQYTALLRAYDNRECGTDTPADRRRLEAAGW